jgi:hyperosmotically inducible periplasmic protein
MMQVNVYRSSILGASALALMLGVSGCDQNAPAETAGKEIDKAMERAAEKVDKAAAAASTELKKEAEQTGAAVSDTAITAKVTAAIQNEPQLKGLQVNVETLSGVVILTGSADSKQSSERAQQLASAVAGVKSVDNRLQVKGMA